MSTVTHLLHQNYVQAPDQVALYLLDHHPSDAAATRITFGTLLQEAAGYAQALTQSDIQPGEVVVLVLQHGADLVYSFCGAILCGAIPSIMPFLTEKLSPERYQEDMSALIKITRPAAIVTQPEFVPLVMGTLRAGDSVRVTLVTTDTRPAAELDFTVLHGLKRSADDIVLLQHSSGTTGLQKGVGLAHRAVLNQLQSYGQALCLSSSDTIVSWLPLYHDMGLIAGFIMPILNRVPLVLMSPFDWVRAPYKLIQAVSQYHGTLTWLPNFAYNFCGQKIRDRDLESVDLSSWRAVINCSEPVRWDSHQIFLKRFQPYGLRPEALTTCYAMAENVFAVTQGRLDTPAIVDQVDQRAFITERRAIPSVQPGGTLTLLSSGRPIANTRVCVLDDQRHQLPDRHIGEIAILSDCMLTGYYNRDDLTAKAFHEGRYLTGDLGYIADGEVYVIGRKKDLIIVGGKNIYPQDLEMLADQVSGVHPGRVVAFGVVNPEIGTEDVIIVAEVETDDPGERERIADQIRQRVTRGSDIALRYVELVGPKWIIKTSSGKVARSANRDKYLTEFQKA
jgi:acyl-CoA synthetase (AMP-forming)/AMP-acid ligase II